MWAMVGTSTFLTYFNDKEPFVPQIFNAATVIIFSTFPFYLTAYVLIPHTLYKKKYAHFVGALMLLVIISGIAMMLGVRTIDHLFDPSKQIIASDSHKLRFDLNIFMWTSMIASFGAGGLKIMSDSFRLRRQLMVVEKEKVNAELNFLRSQINPHFLFNVINTIYFQIDKKNISARASVEKLSEMLRYQLYECTSDKIDISKELDYIKNYVAIQTLRMEKGSDIQLHICGKIAGFKIAPLLILPLVENAFKHVSHFKNPELNKIYISLQQQDEQFIISTTNSFDTTTRVNLLINAGGLGIENLRRRLELIYPDRHEIKTRQGENLFETTLKINYYD